MNLLAIETASSVCGLALFQEGKLVDIQESELYREHAEILPSLYHLLKTNNQFDLFSLNGIAVSIGPGSFTGLRIGLSYAKGLAYSMDIPLVPVPTLQTLAWGTNRHKGEVRCLLYSHKDVVYDQDFTISSSYPVKKNPARSSVWKEAILTQSKEWLICHYGCESFLKETRLKNPVVRVAPSAQYVGEIAIRDFTKLKQKRFYQIEPDYVSSFGIKRDSSKLHGGR